MPTQNYTKEQLDSTQAGNSGASKVGVSAIAGLLGGVATNVQAAIAELVAKKLGIVQDEGLPVVQRPAINFTGAGVSVEDDEDDGRTNVSIPGGGSTAFQDEGSTVTARNTVNFTGGGVAASDDAPNSRTNVSIPGLTVQDEGSVLTQRSTLNFVGGGVTAEDDAAGGRTKVTIPARYGAFTFFASGDVNAKTGVGHDIAMAAGTIDELRVALDAAPVGGSVTVTFVREAGGPGGTTTTIGSVTLAAGARSGSTTGLSVTLAAGDTVRADITTGGGYTAGSAKNLTAKARCSY